MVSNRSFGPCLTDEKGTLLQLGFHGSKCDLSLCVYSKDANFLYMLVYFDDNNITDNNTKLITTIVTNPNSNFSLKELGDLDYS